MPEGFLEAYRRHVKTRQDVEIIRLHILDAVKPFNPGDIFLAVEEMGMKMLIHVSSSNWPSFNTTFDVSHIDWLEEDEVTIAKIVAEHFRNIPYTEPDPSFGLGEN